MQQRKCCATIRLTDDRKSKILPCGCCILTEHYGKRKGSPKKTHVTSVVRSFDTSEAAAKYLKLIKKGEK